MIRQFRMDQNILCIISLNCFFISHEKYQKMWFVGLKVLKLKAHAHMFQQG